jgi:alpha,alpha-trehalase
MPDKDLMLTPDDLYGELYKNVQLNKIFSDTKTFVDCEPKISPNQIIDLYTKEKNEKNFNLTEFVHKYFNLPVSPASTISIDSKLSIIDYIDYLWYILIERDNPSVKRSSLVSLPYPYIVPGGRFRQLFYWDSYFTMLGLSLSSKGLPLVKNMIDNFAYLIDNYGFIPNGNRTYFLSRSQPPFFACMIQLLADLDDHPDHIRHKYVSQLYKEYQFWMMGKDQLTETNNTHQV